MTQLRNTEKRLGDKIKLLEENQRVEVKKQREAIEAAEKIKRCDLSHDVSVIMSYSFYTLFKTGILCDFVLEICDDSASR